MAEVDFEQLDYYSLLGVAHDAPADAIKRAFHDFARRYHPDRHLADPERHEDMLAVYRRGTEAYRVLSDPGARRLYAQCLEQGQLRYDPSIARQSQRPARRSAAPSTRAAVAAPRASAVPPAASASRGTTGTTRPRSPTPAEGLPDAGPLLADVTTGRAREFALRAQQALAVREYRSARLSLRLALSHDAGNARLQEELRKVDRLLGAP